MERDEFTSKHSFLEGYTVESVEMVDGKENKNGQQCVILKKGDSQYKMMVTLKRGKKEDRAVILRENNTLFMELNYVNDEANGELLVYDEMGILVERGYLKNGKRYGSFKTFNKDGEVTKEVRYRNGVSIGPLKESELDGFFEEHNEKGETTAISQFSSNGVDRNGMCYEFEGGKVKRKSLYRDGLLSCTLMEVNGDTMTEYDTDGKRVYEGGYIYDGKKGLLRNGKGTEYTDDSALYVGFFFKGERSGDGTLFDGFAPVYIGGWKNGKRYGRGKEMDSDRKVLKDGMWIDDVFVTDDFVKKLKIKVDTVEYTVKNKKNNDANIQSFFIPSTFQLKKIEIGKMCFRNVTRFVIDGLNELKSMKIGKNSFTTGNGKLITVQEGSQFCIMNCPKLREIDLGDESFSSCIGFQVKNLPSLETFRTGNWCFFFESTFELRSKTEIGVIDKTFHPYVQSSWV